MPLLKRLAAVWMRDNEGHVLLNPFEDLPPNPDRLHAHADGHVGAHQSRRANADADAERLKLHPRRLADADDAVFCGDVFADSRMPEKASVGGDVDDVAV